MAEEKKPEADKNAPKKAAAPRRTKAKTSSKPEVKAQTADTAAETANKTESQWIIQTQLYDLIPLSLAELLFLPYHFSSFLNVPVATSWTTLIARAMTRSTIPTAHA